MSIKLKGLRGVDATVKIIELGCCPICGGFLELNLIPTFEVGTDETETELFLYEKTTCESCDYVSGIVEMVAEEEV